MGWTKRQIIVEAYEEVGLSSYEYDLSPEELQSGLRKLDVMMARWGKRGVRIGYPLVSSPEDSDLDTETGVPDWSVEAIYTNLAIRLAQGFGKQVSRETKVCAREGYAAILAETKPPELQLTNLPRGQGAKTWRRNEDVFLDKPEDPLLAGDDDTLDFLK